MRKPLAHNKLKIRGVHQRKSGKYRAMISIAGANTNLGTFATVGEAAAAYAKADNDNKAA